MDDTINERSFCENPLELNGRKNDLEVNPRQHENIKGIAFILMMRNVR